MSLRRRALTIGRTTARYLNLFEGGGGLLALLTALALWVWVLAGVAAPLGAALVEIEARRMPVTAVAAHGEPSAALATASRTEDPSR